jgi:hypothetical protein
MPKPIPSKTYGYFCSPLPQIEFLKMIQIFFTVSSKPLKYFFDLCPNFFLSAGYIAISLPQYCKQRGEIVSLREREREREKERERELTHSLFYINKNDRLELSIGSTYSKKTFYL